jgi:hypothetical protein
MPLLYSDLSASSVNTSLDLLAVTILDLVVFNINNAFSVDSNGNNEYRRKII